MSQNRGCNGNINILISITVDILEHQFGARCCSRIQFNNCAVFAGNIRTTLGSVNVSCCRINSTGNCNLGIAEQFIRICRFFYLFCSQLCVGICA